MRLRVFVLILVAVVLVALGGLEIASSRVPTPDEVRPLVGGP